MNLRPVADAPAVVACSSCRFAAAEREDPQGRRGGTLLVEALRSAKAQDPAYDGVDVEEMPCLFACGEHCTVHLRAPGKVGYVLGRFTPDAEAARAILDYAALYADSQSGQVPFRQWPAGVKGHFIVRTPPPGFVVE